MYRVTTSWYSSKAFCLLTFSEFPFGKKGSLPVIPCLKSAFLISFLVISGEKKGNLFILDLFRISYSSETSKQLLIRSFVFILFPPCNYNYAPVMRIIQYFFAEKKRAFLPFYFPFPNLHPVFPSL